MRITEDLIKQYRDYLYEEERSVATINKYICDLHKLMDYAGRRNLDKKLLISYKKALQKSGKYKTSSINSFIVAANSFFQYMKLYSLRIKTFKIQKEVFALEDRDLSKKEYEKLVRTALMLGKDRLAMVMQTMCATGIRISELEAVTVESIKKGMITVCCKGKERQVLMPRSLQVKLMDYIRRKDIRYGKVFCTSSGKAVNRSNIWREMKLLCKEAGVDEEKVFPHNLRHLFAKTFYNGNKDIAKLSNILGHSNI